MTTRTEKAMAENPEGYDMTFDQAAQSEPIMKYFKYDHLPARLQEISRPFGELAMKIFYEQPRNAERAAGLRKLLEAKDCIVRASL